MSLRSGVRRRGRRMSQLVKLADDEKHSKLSFAFGCGQHGLFRPSISRLLLVPPHSLVYAYASLSSCRNFSPSIPPTVQRRTPSSVPQRPRPHPQHIATSAARWAICHVHATRHPALGARARLGARRRSNRIPTIRKEKEMFSREGGNG